MSPLPWPIQGRCGACLHRAEQYPSGNWRHTETRSCAQRNTMLWRPGVDLPIPKAEFVVDGAELPEPDERGYWQMQYEDGEELPSSMGWHSPRQVADYWGRVREWLHEQTAQEATS